MISDCWFYDYEHWAFLYNVGTLLLSNRIVFIHCSTPVFHPPCTVVLPSQ